MVSVPSNSNNSTSAFPQDYHHALACCRVLYEYPLYHQHRLLNSCVLKSRNKKINIATVPSSTFLSEIGSFFSSYPPETGPSYNCKYMATKTATTSLVWCRRPGLHSASSNKAPPLLMHHQHKRQQMWRSSDHILRTLTEAKPKCH